MHFNLAQQHYRVHTRPQQHQVIPEPATRLEEFFTIRIEEEDVQIGGSSYTRHTNEGE